ncbi:MAG: beta-ketoacyl-ACP synthase II [Betaproteobacteria bacterium]|nr:beta-ketoacyl-ACP synthase II [Betaproteobacteria bacterium]
MKANLLQRVVITGMGAVTPLGNNAATFWNKLVAGQSGAGPITHFDAAKFKTRFACEVKGFDAEQYLERKEARKTDPVTHYAIAAVDEALKSSGLLDAEVDRNEVGVIWGSGIGGMQTFEAQMIEFGEGDGTPRFNPFFIPKTLIDTTSGWLAIRYGFRGINYTAVSACATSNTTIMDAFNYIRWGKAEAMIAGGSEAAITMGGIGGFNAMKALSTRNENPQTASRPYDAGRDGFVMGEGAGALVLESLEHAQKRGARVYAEVIGAGMSADAYHLTATHPDGLGVRLALNRALQDAGIRRDEVDYINTHATSTPDGDLNELKAIQSVFGEHVRSMNISATKSMTGHLLGAAGAVEGVACIHALLHDLVPPTINVEQLDPGVPEGFNLTPGKAVRRKVNIAMSNTFGFGGHNAIVLFKKFGGY